jgi:ribosomal silencing factor RsfS
MTILFLSWLYRHFNKEDHVSESWMLTPIAEMVLLLLLVKIRKGYNLKKRLNVEKRKPKSQQLGSP